MQPRHHDVLAMPVLCCGSGGPPSQQLLLDLPTDLLCEVLRRVPPSKRSTCRRFRQLLDASCREVRLRTQPDGTPPCNVSALLRRLPLLRTLATSPCEFARLPFLAACPALTSLTLDACATRTPAAAASLLGQLTVCPHLTTLHLCWAHPPVAAPLAAALTALRSLHLLYCRTDSLAALAQCPHLTSLHLIGGDATTEATLASLHALPALSTLALHHLVRPCALAALAACASLTSLSLSACPTLDDLRALPACRQLSTLSLDYLTRLASLRSLAACPSLTALHISLCPAVTSIAPLAGLGHSLINLSLDRSPGIFDISPLSECTAVKHVTLVGTRVTSVWRALAPCLELETLSVGGCRLPHDQLRLLQAARGTQLLIQGMGSV